jgi:hypothetical protein
MKSVALPPGQFLPSGETVGNGAVPLRRVVLAVRSWEGP